MRYIIIVFDKPDIFAAVNLLKEYSDAEVWVFSPYLIDVVVGAGICSYRLIDIDMDINSSVFYADIREQVVTIEKSLEEKLVSLGLNMIGELWQHLNLYFLVGLIESHVKLFDLFLENDFSLYHFLVPVNKMPGIYYRPSFIPCILCLERMVAKGVKFSGFVYNDDISSADAYLIPDVSPANIGLNQYNIFVHIPTCFYDCGLFETELIASGNDFIKIDSRDWDVSFQSRSGTGLISTDLAIEELDGSLVLAIEQVFEEVKCFYYSFFMKYFLTEEYLMLQATHFANLYRSQLIFYFLLDKSFSRKKPRKIILSNHDAGFHGPFLYFANKYNISVLLLPHSKVFNFPVPSVSGSRCHVLAHPIQVDVVSTFTGQSVLASTLEFHQSLSFPGFRLKSLSVVGLVLNVSTNDGIVLINLNRYLDGIRILKGWCDDNRVNLSIRVRPGAGLCVKWLSDELGLDSNELYFNSNLFMDEYAKTCDVCFMYDAPTSGAITFLNNSIPILSLLIRDLSFDESHIVNPDLVPNVLLANAIAYLNFFKDDPVNLHLFRLKQFGRYISRCAQAKPLRVFL